MYYTAIWWRLVELQQHPPSFSQGYSSVLYPPTDNDRGVGQNLGMEKLWLRWASLETILRNFLMLITWVWCTHRCPMDHSMHPVTASIQYIFLQFWIHFYLHSAGVVSICVSASMSELSSPHELKGFTLNEWQMYLPVFFPHDILHHWHKITHPDGVSWRAWCE